MSRRIQTISTALATFFVLGIAVVWLTGSGSAYALFRTVAVTRGDITEIVSATGTLNPVHLVEVGTQVSGKVSKLHVKVNEKVKAGQVLAEIDPALLLAQIKQDRTALETARAAYEQAQRDMERTRVLLAKGYVAKVDWERAQQALLSAKNNYEAAQTIIERDEVNLSYAKITSPIDGVVIARDVTEGQTLQATFQAPTLFKIAGNLDEMKIEVNFSETDIMKVREGMPVTFTVNAFPSEQFQGTVQTVNLSPQQQQGLLGAIAMYAVTLSVDNSARKLLPGMTAYASVTLSQQNDVLRVPAAALRFTPPPEQVSGLRRLFTGPPARTRTVGVQADALQKTLYILRENKPVPVQVTVGASDESFVAVSGPEIAEGDLVITGIQRVTGKR